MRKADRGDKQMDRNEPELKNSKFSQCGPQGRCDTYVEQTISSFVCLFGVADEPVTMRNNGTKGCNDGSGDKRKIPEGWENERPEHDHQGHGTARDVGPEADRDGLATHDAVSGFVLDVLNVDRREDN